MSSIRPITGTGLKKCIPITRSARAEASPRVAIGIDDVFDARTTSWPCRLAEPAEDRALRAGVFGGGLDHEIDGRETGDVVHRIDASEGGVAGGVVQLSLGHRAVE